MNQVKLFFRAFIFINPGKEVQNQPLLETDKSLNKVNNNPANIYMLKFNNRSSRKRSKICSKLTIKRHKTDVNDVVLAFLLLTLDIFQTFYYCFYCWLWKGKCLLGEHSSKVSMNAIKANENDTRSHIFWKLSFL